MIEAVLVGDVGGTSVRFAVASRGDHSEVALKGFAKLRNDDFPSFESALTHYVGDLDSMPAFGLFALAGPVEADGGVQLTNRDWPRVAPGNVANAAGLQQCRLVNDFAAMARAVPEMPDSAFVTVLDGRPDPTAPIIVTGPGTGFGVGTLVPLAPGQFHVLTGEGGHAAYAAHTVREADVAEHLYARHGYVSTEMIVSGAWLQPVYDIVADLHGESPEGIPAAEILSRAAAGDPVSEEVCRLRARAIMGAAGDLALINNGRGGVVLTGGVAERMVGWLQRPEAVDRFRQRGVRSDVVADIPVRVLTDPTAPLVGAAALALKG